MIFTKEFNQLTRHIVSTNSIFPETSGLASMAPVALCFRYTAKYTVCLKALNPFKLIQISHNVL